MFITLFKLNGCITSIREPIFSPFFPNCSFSNGGCAPLVGAMRISAHRDSASDVFEPNVLLHFLTYIKTLLKVGTA